jgi:hypothetical protein
MFKIQINELLAIQLAHTFSVFMKREVYKSHLLVCVLRQLNPLHVLKSLF